MTALVGKKLTNQKASIKDWLAQLPEDSVIGLEATGGHGQLLADLAYARGFKVYVLCPRQVSSYRVSLGRRAKTDSLDAHLIRDFLVSNHQHLHPYKPWDEPWKTIRDLVRLRCGLAKDRARIITRMRTRGCSAADISKLTNPIKEMMQEIQAKLESLLEKNQGYQVLKGINGIGPITAAATTAALSQIPFSDADSFVAYMGSDMKVEESGKGKKVRRISRWGDQTLRNLYYNCASAAGARDTWKPYKDKMKDKGLTSIQAQCALARKIARTAFFVFKRQESFNSDLALPNETRKQMAARSKVLT